MTAARAWSESWPDTETAPVRVPTLTLPYEAPTVTAEQQHRAALTVVRHVPRAHCREVLEALGLVAS